MTNQEKARKERMEAMREVVIESELQARYWKALYEAKYYSLEDEKIKPAYDEYVNRIQKETMELAEQAEKLAELNKTGISTTDTLTTGNIIV